MIRKGNTHLLIITLYTNTPNNSFIILHVLWHFEMVGDRHCCRCHHRSLIKLKGIQIRFVYSMWVSEIRCRILDVEGGYVWDLLAPSHTQIKNYQVAPASGSRSCPSIWIKINIPDFALQEVQNTIVLDVGRLSPKS